MLKAISFCWLTDFGKFIKVNPTGSSSVEHPLSPISLRCCAKTLEMCSEKIIILEWCLLEDIVSHSLPLRSVRCHPMAMLSIVIFKLTVQSRESATYRQGIQHMLRILMKFRNHTEGYKKQNCKQWTSLRSQAMFRRNNYINIEVSSYYSSINIRVFRSIHFPRLYSSSFLCELWLKPASENLEFFINLGYEGYLAFEKKGGSMLF